jgi:DNA-binding response OmpR family regulator
LSPSKTALVIDDEADIKELVRDVLEMRGIRVLTAETRDNAIPLLDQSPDLIVMDCQMPGMSAANFLQVARKDREVPVILITALANGADKAKALNVTRFIAKPFEIATLATAAEELLK